MKQLIFAALFLCSAVFCEETKVEEGHSMHGEVFNVGPRQAAVMIEGTGAIDFPISTKSEQAQAFFNQGIGQLHGYWEFEAERSFRQAAAIDPDCAMAYWGMAMANYKNSKRAKDFLKEALARKDKFADDREKLWIDSLNAYFDESTGKTKERRKAIVQSIKNIVEKYPDDLEAKAFVFRWTYQNSRKGIPIPDYAAMTKAAEEIFSKNPQHPIHHYVIHMWDRKTPANALGSAKACGPSAPGVAHMWHMPGHIFSKLKNYQVATWYQEASARVDHAHMMKYHLLPDQIHNFAHNNEWLIRNLNYVGRCDDAVSLAKNMTELPRVPKFRKKDDDSSYDPGKSSWRHGRRHLKDTLFRFEKWNELLALESTPYLVPDGRTIYQSDLDRYYAIARFETGDSEGGQALLDKIKKGSSAFNEVSVYKALNAEPPNMELAKSLLPKLKSVAKVRHAWLWYRVGNLEKAMAMANDAVKSTASQVLPLAVKVQIFHAAGKIDEAKQTFESLRTVAGSADSDLPALQRLSAIAKEFGLPEKWQVTPAEVTEPGRHLDSLGPFRWSPPQATDFQLKNFEGKEHQLSSFGGKATLVIFFLGKGCVHCMEQLNEFAPAVEKYREAGIEIVAISSDSTEGLAETFAFCSEDDDKAEAHFPFPLLSDSKLDIFKQYRAFDDFENQPLHGTFLIDGEQKIRWQDIGFEPFMYSDWLLDESKRLLGMDL